MELVFRRLPDGTPPAHTLWLRPADPGQRHHRDLACLAADEGPDAFERGAGNITTIVVQQNPTLDDMLAACIVERQLIGESLPAGLSSLCRYAALCREGLRPGSVPVEESPEGVHAALRSLAGPDLTQPEAGSRFARDSRELAEALFAGLEKGLDPFKVTLIGQDERFARPRAFLQEDRKVYRQDVARGERWLIRIPDGPERTSGLFLDRPKSLLWKYWARTDEEAPVGGSYVFTAVHWGQGQWVFSTDPVHRQSIRGLADRLQAAEERTNGRAATEDPWFDGRPFGHTLVSAPRGGSRLSDREVLRIARQWLSVRRAPAPRTAASSANWALTGVALACVAALLVVVLRPAPVPERKPAPEPRVTVEDETFVSTDHDRSRLFVLGIGISEYADPTLTLNYADDDAHELVLAFRTHAQGFFDGEPRVRLVAEADPARLMQPDAPPTREGILSSLLWLESSDPDERPSRNDLVIITISGHGLVDRDGEFYLLTRDHTGGSDPRLHGLSWKLDIARTLNRLSCTTIVILDTCHAGAAVHAGSRAAKDPDAFESVMQSAVEAFRGNEKGVLLLPACLDDQKALENTGWGHGALSLAVLEALEGRVRNSGWTQLDEAARARLPHSDVVAFGDIEWYVQHRVYELTLALCGKDGAQLVEVRNSNPEVLKRRIPLAVRSARI